MADGEVRIEIKPDGTQQFIIDVGKAAEDAGEAANKASKGKSGFFKEIWTGAARAVGEGLVSLAAKSTEAIVGVVKDSAAAFADYEQLVGGVETLFGAGGLELTEYAESVGKTVNEVQREYRVMMDAQNAVFQNAANAYKTAGMSANEYMETATSFAARLVSGLGGDTKKAAELTDVAITDMADNANKMGTDLAAIENAYQGFAKQNYTMLDNLKLGYGGTAGEMARLINESGVLGASMTVTAKTVNNVPFDKMISAIHIVQERMGITGTTAKEAATTIQGSVNSMKAAWENLLVGVADDTQDFDKLVKNFVGSASVAADNILPRIETALDGVADLVAALLPEILTMVLDMVPSLLDAADQLITSLLDAILDNLPAFTQAGFDLLVELILGLASNLPTLMPEITGVILDIIDILTDPENLQKLLDAGWDLCVAVIEGLIRASLDLSDRVPEIIDNIVTFLLDAINLEKLDAAGQKLLDSVMIGFLDDGSKIDNAAATIIKRLAKALWNSIFPLRSVSASIGNSIADWIMGGSGSTAISRGTSSAFSTSGAGGGRHASGLTYVPYDGYMAQLHVGERVLTANEARDYDAERYVTQKLMTSGGMGAREIIVPLYIDGHEFARATAWDMGESLAWEEM